LQAIAKTLIPKIVYHTLSCVVLSKPLTFTQNQQREGTGSRVKIREREKDILFCEMPFFE
jgi:hypothetical protein